MNGVVKEQFGSKSGFLKFLGYWAYAKLGGFNSYPPVKPLPSQRLIFVCSGNICRSPLAEAYATNLGWESASCGLNCSTGHPADSRAKDFAKVHGLDLDGHRTVNVKDFDFNQDDYVVVMEPAHLVSLKTYNKEGFQVVLAGSFLARPYPYIHDPYNCNSEFFQRCERRVLDAVGRICG